MGDKTEYITRITGENLSVTNSLFLMAKVLGVSSPNTMVTKLSGTTTTATDTTSATRLGSASHSCNTGENISSAPAPPAAAAMAPTSVMPICTTARLPSIWSFIKRACSAPKRFSWAKMDNLVREMEARAISYAANRAFSTNIKRMINIVMGYSVAKNGVKQKGGSVGRPRGKPRPA